MRLILYQGQIAALSARVAKAERALSTNAARIQEIEQRVWDDAWAQSVAARLSKAEQRLDAIEQPNGERERIQHHSETPCPLCPPFADAVAPEPAPAPALKTGDGTATVYLNFTANELAQIVARHFRDYLPKPYGDSLVSPGYAALVLARDYVPKAEADFADLRASFIQAMNAKNDAEARVRDLEAKIVAIEAWGRRWIAAGGSHARWSAFEALLSKEQPNG